MTLMMISSRRRNPCAALKENYHQNDIDAMKIGLTYSYINDKQLINLAIQEINNIFIQLLLIKPELNNVGVEDI